MQEELKRIVKRMGDLPYKLDNENPQCCRPFSLPANRYMPGAKVTAPQREGRYFEM